MADQNTELLVRIITAYESGGIDAANREIAAAKEQLEGATQAANKHGAAHESMRGKIRGASEEMHALSAILQGRFGEGISSASRGLAHLAGSFSSMIGLTAVVGVVVGGIASMVAKWQEQVAKQREAMQSLHDYGVELDQVAKNKSLDAAIENINLLREAWDGAASAAERLKKSQEQLESARGKAELAKYDAETEAMLAKATPEGREQIRSQRGIGRAQIEQKLGDAEAAAKVKAAEDAAAERQRKLNAGVIEVTQLGGEAGKAESEKQKAIATMQAAGLTPDMMHAGGEMWKDIQADKRKEIEDLQKTTYEGETQAGPNGATFTPIITKSPERIAQDKARAAEIQAALDTAQGFSEIQKRADETKKKFEEMLSKNAVEQQKLGTGEAERNAIEAAKIEQGTVATRGATGVTKATVEARDADERARKQKVEAEIGLLEAQQKEKTNLTDQLAIADKIKEKRLSVARPEDRDKIEEQAKLARGRIVSESAENLEKQAREQERVDKERLALGEHYDAGRRDRRGRPLGMSADTLSRGAAVQHDEQTIATIEKLRASARGGDAGATKQLIDLINKLLDATTGGLNAHAAAIKALEVKVSKSAGAIKSGGLRS